MLNAAAFALALALPPAVAAQGGSGADTLVVKTIPLHHLSNNDAVLLISPYIMGRGGVYAAGTSIHAVTLRGSAKTVADMEKLLAQYDRSPVTVTLNFQLVTADYSNYRDPAVAGLDSVLRSVLRFSGYRLTSTAVVNVSEHQMASQTLSAGGHDYRLSCEITDISGEGPDATVQLQVDLRRLGVGTPVDPVVLSTGVTTPIGHTVVLGTSMDAGHAGPIARKVQPGGAEPSARSADERDNALILVVRPQVSRRD
jgi:hypothetical protein